MKKCNTELMKELKAVQADLAELIAEASNKNTVNYYEGEEEVERADVIILLYDELYENNKVKPDDKMKDIRHIEAIIAKQRNGRTGVAHLLFSKPFSRYDSLSKEWEQQYEDLARQKYDD